MHQQLDSISRFLREAKMIDVDKPPPGALDDAMARKAVRAAGTIAPGSDKGRGCLQSTKAVASF